MAYEQLEPGRGEGRPDVQYAGPEGAAVAYQLVGNGSVDLVFLPEWMNNLEMQWDEPKLARFPSQLAAFSRVIMLNTRGIGLSDPLSHGASTTIEQWMGDITTVLEAVDAKHVALFGTGWAEVWPWCSLRPTPSGSPRWRS